MSTAPVEGTEYDFRQPRAIGETKLDNAFTDLERGDDGLARVEVRHPDNGTELTLWLDESYPYLQLFTGDSQPSVNRRSLAVEPMTCPPNAFRTGEAFRARAGPIGNVGMGHPRMSAEDLDLAQQFLDALAVAAKTGDRDVSTASPPGSGYAEARAPRYRGGTR